MLEIRVMNQELIKSLLVISLKVEGASGVLKGEALS